MQKKTLYGITGIAILAVAFTIYKTYSGNGRSFEVETIKITKGGISNTITATGTIEAITTVEVGTQVSGVIQKIYADFNTLVKKGQLLATLDETPLRATLEQSKASVDQAEAELKYQQANFERNKALAEKQLIAQSDFDLAEYNFNKALAALNNAKSVFEKNRINLSYARIYSPIDGIILDRAVDEGQTVAASFNTPTLFTIANDLTRMQVEADIDEADIGQVQLGQRVEFTVQTYPDRKFDGEVSEIRLQPVESSNVITYTVIINAPNPDKKLMPGMTASTTIFVREKRDINVIAGKAFRFNPDEELLQAYMKSQPISQMPRPQGPQPDRPQTSAEATSDSLQTIWVKEGVIIHPKLVKIGDNDGINYEVIDGLQQQDEVVVALTEQKEEEAPATQSKSPFMPQRPKR